MALPLISIIITSYNYGSMIGEAIESACAQDYPNIEVLVLDNASTDHTDSVIQRYINQPRVRYVRNTFNIGATANHNRGVIESRGEYLMFLSADDRFAPDQVSATYGFLKAHPDAQVAYSEIKYIDDEGRDAGERAMLIPLHYIDMPNSLALYLSWGCYSAFETLLIPREIFGLYGLMDPAFIGADYELMTRWAAAGVKLAQLPGRYLSYRIHRGQDSGADKFYANGKGLLELLSILERYVTAENMTKLRPYRNGIMRHINRKFDYAVAQGFVPDEEISRRANAINDRFTSGGHLGAISLQPKKTHVIILANGCAEHLEATLDSLARQTSPHWEATVLHPFGSFPAIRRRAGKVREMVLQERTPEGAMLNAAIPFSTAPYTAFLRAGNIIPPGHISAVQASFAAHSADVVLTPPRLTVNGQELEGGDVYTNIADVTATVVAPNMPLDSLTVSARTLDEIGWFDPRNEILAEWNFMMRRYGTIAVATARDSCVYINETAGIPNNYAASPHFLAELEQTYERLQCNEDHIRNARAAYTAHMRDLVPTLSVAPWTAREHLLWHQAVCGQFALVTA